MGTNRVESMGTEASSRQRRSFRRFACSFCSTKSVGSASFRWGAAVLALLATASAGVLPPTSPLWPPVYDLGLSTITMQCNGSGWSSPERGAVRPFRRSIHRVRFGGPCCFVVQEFGIVSYDWSNAKAQWAASKPMDCEERLLQQATMTKQLNPASHVFVYRNVVKASA